ncbi:hypothetical protein [Cysteiniphilum litorale]|uniref:hypothetical protein n=1 Tax=Cysteiniphilum litorale TaxID=2056700 RepID=UPI003F882F92
MIRNYLTMALGLPVLLFAGNCRLGSSTANMDIDAHLNVEEQITLIKPDTNITLSHQPGGSQHGVNNIAYAGLSGEFRLTSNIHNPQYNIQCTPTDIGTQNGGRQNYQGYLYQNGLAHATNDIMGNDKVTITLDNSSSNTSTFQLLFVLPNGVKYKMGTHSSQTTCTISA